MTKLTKLHAEEALLQRQLANVKVAQINEEKKIEDEALLDYDNSKKVIVQKLPTGSYQLEIKHNNKDARLNVMLTEAESKDLVKQLLSSFNDFSFAIQPELGLLEDSFNDLFGSKTSFKVLENGLNDFIRLLK